MLKLKLIDRFELKEVPSPNIWFRYGKWSVLNCGELNKTHPYPQGLFMGWEAMDKNHNIIGAENWEQLKKLL